MFVCERLKGREVFRVGFADRTKAINWYNDQREHFEKLRDNYKLKEDVYLTVSEEVEEPVKVVTGVIHAMYKVDSPTTKITIELDMYDLLGLKSCVKLMRAGLAKAIGIMDDKSCNRLIGVIDKGLSNYEDN